MDLNSAFVLRRATMICFLLSYVTGLPQITVQYQEEDYMLVEDPALSTSMHGSMLL